MWSSHGEVPVGVVLKLLYVHRSIWWGSKNTMFSGFIIHGLLPLLLCVLFMLPSVFPLRGRQRCALAVASHCGAAVARASAAGWAHCQCVMCTWQVSLQQCCSLQQCFSLPQSGVLPACGLSAHGCARACVEVQCRSFYRSSSRVLLRSKWTCSVRSVAVQVDSFSVAS